MPPNEIYVEGYFGERSTEDGPENPSLELLLEQASALVTQYAGSIPKDEVEILKGELIEVIERSQIRTVLAKRMWPQEKAARVLRALESRFLYPWQIARKYKLPFDRWSGR